ncbi:hypothetical protein HPB51_018989 [Rhipicephalus microplus]|uniref:Uncharacterized protein n=1 Tax=Rhipicephalus microplus TaxID=6941 RepID=A0A9J6D657_RHIMP|nr:hypothetical protein HPB51_018989 [Rhipicephalus microplus]
MTTPRRDLENLLQYERCPDVENSRPEDDYATSKQCNGAKFHEEFFMVPVLKEQVEQHCKFAKDAAIPPLNRTEAIDLYGYNKVGDDSFPNQVPLLTGRSGEEAMSLCPEKFFDNLEFIWDKYASLGYKTLFLE